MDAPHIEEYEGFLAGAPRELMEAHAQV